MRTKGRKVLKDENKQIQLLTMFFTCFFLFLALFLCSCAKPEDVPTVKAKSNPCEMVKDSRPVKTEVEYICHYSDMDCKMYRAPHSTKLVCGEISQTFPKGYEDEEKK
jgi:hypothetical protein